MTGNSKELKTIGILGGMGPDSTIDYYRGIINYFRSGTGAINYPEIVIYSVNLTEAIQFIHKKGDFLVRWLLEKINILHNSGADFVAIASNTPHIVFEELKKKSDIPLISIIEETLKAVKKSGFSKIGLIGTKTTMETELYKKPFGENQISLFVPNEKSRNIINKKIFDELEIGIIKKETKEILLEIVNEMILKNNIEALILGCTELPMIFPNDELGISFINTTKIHIESIISYCIG